MKCALYVDLDGTLIRTDLLYESLLGLVHRNPLAIFLVPFWLRRGRAHMERAIAERVPIARRQVAIQRVFPHVSQERSGLGRRLILATASDHRYATQVAITWEFSHPRSRATAQ